MPRSKGPTIRAEVSTPPGEEYLKRERARTQDALEALLRNCLGSVLPRFSSSCGSAVVTALTFSRLRVQNLFEFFESLGAAGWIFIDKIKQFHERRFDVDQQSRVEPALSFNVTVVGMDRVVTEVLDDLEVACVQPACPVGAVPATMAFSSASIFRPSSRMW